MWRNGKDSENLTCAFHPPTILALGMLLTIYVGAWGLKQKVNLKTIQMEQSLWQVLRTNLLSPY